MALVLFIVRMRWTLAPHRPLLSKACMRDLWQTRAVVLPFQGFHQHDLAGRYKKLRIIIGVKRFRQSPYCNDVAGSNPVCVPMRLQKVRNSCPRLAGYLYTKSLILVTKLLIRNCHLHLCLAWVILVTYWPVNQSSKNIIAWSLTRDAVCDISVSVTTLFGRLSYSK